MGLAVSKQLVELMGGTIRAESVSGKGSTFRFDLPLQLDTKAPDQASEPGLNGLRVLIVSANGLTRKVVNEQVASWGMRTGSPRGAFKCSGRVANRGSGERSLFFCNLR